MRCKKKKIKQITKKKKKKKEDSKVQNNIRLKSVEKSRDELFTSGNTNLSVYVI